MGFGRYYNFDGQIREDLYLSGLTLPDGPGLLLNFHAAMPVRQGALRQLSPYNCNHVRSYVLD
jgi:hypothetical protein